MHRGGCCASARRAPLTVHIPQAVCNGRRSFDQICTRCFSKRELFHETLMPAEISGGEALGRVEESS